MRDGLFPVQRAFFPQVDVAHHQDQNVNEHLHEAEELQLPENDGPGIEEDRFDVEQDEDYRHHVEVHGIRSARVTGRANAALIGLVLDLRARMTPDHIRHHNHHAGGSGRQQKHKQERGVSVQVVLAHSWTPLEAILAHASACVHRIRITGLLRETPRLAC